MSMHINENTSRIQVAIFWSERTLDVVQFKNTPGILYAGVNQECDIHVPDGFLPNRSFPLLEIEDNKVRVQKFPGLYVLQQHDSTQLQFGKMGLAVSRVSVSPLHRLSFIDGLDRLFIYSFLVSLAFVTTIVFMMLTRARPPEEHIWYNVPERFVTCPPSACDKIDSSLSGLPGKAGNPGTPDLNRLEAWKAISESDQEMLTRRCVLTNLHANGFTRRSLATLGTGLGGGPFDVLGGLSGVELGESGGTGGLSDKGSGEGGGYRGRGPCMVSNLARRIPIHFDFIGSGILTALGPDKLQFTTNAKCELHKNVLHVDSQGSDLFPRFLHGVSVSIKFQYDGTDTLVTDLKIWHENADLQWSGAEAKVRLLRGIFNTRIMTSTFLDQNTKRSQKWTIAFHCENYQILSLDW